MRIGQKGFTLVEIIVSLAIMTIVAGSVGAFIVAGNNSYLRGSKELTLQEEAQLTANQMIDLIIDVEKDIQFLDSTGAAVALDGTPAKDASGNVINSTNVSELRLYNNDNVYMIRWQGDDGSGYDTANQIYLYEAKNSVTTDADGNETIVWGDLTAEDVKPALMAEHVTSFNVDISEAKTTRKVVLNMTFAYMEKTYTIAETIKLRNDLSKEDSEAYMWITGLKINPTHADLKQGQTAVFTFEFTGDSEAVAEAKAKGVEWSVSKQDGTSCPSTISTTGKLQVDAAEGIGADALLVTCTSLLDRTKSATATVTVLEPSLDSLTITPKSGSIVPLSAGETGNEQYAIRDGKRIDFVCTLVGDESAKAKGVEWEVKYADDTPAASGTKVRQTRVDSENGLIYASLVADENEIQGLRVLKVTCTSKANRSMSDTAWIDVSSVPGKYTVELIARTITTYPFKQDGQDKIGYMANIECLPSWANYEKGYPIIQWEIVGNSDGYTLEKDPTDSYKQNLYCSYHMNTTVTVKATVEIDKGVFVYPTIDIKLGDLKSSIVSGAPYINSDQLVMYRNGRIECWLENYTVKEGEKVTWIIANDVDLGLAKSRDLEALEGSMGEGEFNEKIRSQRLVGFTTSKSAETGHAANYDGSRNSYNVYASATTSSKDEHVYIWSKYDLPWNQEYRLNLQALDSSGNVIAQTDIFIPQCKVLFPGGKRYVTFSSGEKIDDSICICGQHPKKTHWDGNYQYDPTTGKQLDRRRLTDVWIPIEFYGIYMGKGANDGGDGLCTSGAHKDSIGVKIYADQPIQQWSTSVSEQVETWVNHDPDKFAVHLNISGFEMNDRFYLYFYNTQKYNDQEYMLDRQLVIYWNSYCNGKLKE